MPIAVTEWDQGALDPAATRPDPAPVGGATPAAQVRSFLRTNENIAFSRAEVVRGAAAKPSVSPTVLGRILAELPNQLADLRADFEAGEIDVDALSRALDDRRTEGVVTCRRIDRGDGEPAVYYRHVA